MHGRFWIALLLTFFIGCVERTVTIDTQPKGALVYLNDKEVGRTPVTVPFEWYGDYDVTIRHEGYEPLKTHRKVVQPWYEYIPIDIFSELLYPGVIHDDHSWEFDLKVEEPVNVKDLQERALGIREEAGGQEKAAASQPATDDEEKETKK